VHSIVLGRIGLRRDSKANIVSYRSIQALFIDLICPKGQLITPTQLDINRRGNLTILLNTCFDISIMVTVTLPL
jgi:hypothetical protein